MLLHMLVAARLQGVQARRLQSSRPRMRSSRPPGAWRDGAVYPTLRLEPSSPIRIAFRWPDPGSKSSQPILPSRDRFLLGDKHSDDDEALGSPYGIRPVIEEVLDTELLAGRDVGVGRPRGSDEECGDC